MAKFVSFTRRDDGKTCYINPETVATVTEKSVGTETISRIVLTAGGYMEVTGTPEETVKFLSI